MTPVTHGLGPDTVATVEQAIGQPLPDDPAQALDVIVATTRRLREQRRRLERDLELDAATHTAIAAVNHDIILRISPRLRAAQQHGEAVRRRLHRARWRADRTLANLAHWTRSQRARVDDTDDDTVDDPATIPAVAAMRSAIDRHREQRQITDRIGGHDVADGTV